MDLYGISSSDIDFSQKKREKQIDFLSSTTFTTSSGVVKTLLDINMGANISTRYYAQLVNKVNTLQQVMSNENLSPVFLTITLDGWIQRLLLGDYSKFDDEKHLYKLPENDKYGYLRTKASKREFFDVHDLYMVLRWQWEKFCSERTFRKMRKVSKVGYIFAVEPHTSGAPHSHVLLYVPDEFRNDLKEDFIRIFDAPRNRAQSKRKRANSKKGLTSFQIANGEINGFQWTLSNPVGYILKYVTKSFMDIKNQAQIDELEAWYIKHRISRISTSHSLIPQWVYQKIYPLESDWLYLTNLKDGNSCEWSFEDDYFKFEDGNLNKTFIYNRGLYQYFINGTLEREFGSPKEPKEINTMLQPHRVISSLVPRPLRFPVSFDGDFKFTHKGDIVNYVSNNLQSYLRKFMKNKLELNFYDVSLKSITFTHFVPKQECRTFKKKFISPNNSDKLPIFFIGEDGKKHKFKSAITFSSRSDIDLLAHYSCSNPLNPDYRFFPFVHDNFAYYTLLKNECIKRGLIQGSIQSCNSIFVDENPYAEEFKNLKTHFICKSAVNSLISLKNSICNIGA